MLSGTGHSLRLLPLYLYALRATMSTMPTGLPPSTMGAAMGLTAGAELLAQGVEGGEVVGVLLVELGDVDRLGQVGVGEALPGLLGADVDAVLGGDDYDAGVGDAQGLGDLAGEVKVTRGVQDIYLRLLVLRIHRGQGDAYLAADLLGVEVGDAVARGGAAHAVGDAGQEQDALREGGLAVAAVAEQGDVADVFCCVAHVWVHSFLYLKRNVFPKINHLII